MRFRYLIALPAAMLIACGRNDKKVDDALNNDLSLAQQQQAQDTVSGVERGYANPAAARTTSGTSRTATRTSTTRRSTSGGTYSTAPARQPVVVKNTKRDAVIGGVAGAAIGAVTSKNKVKGAVIGGTAGAILGAVIGNNVDKTKK